MSLLTTRSGWSYVGRDKAYIEKTLPDKSVYRIEICIHGSFCIRRSINGVPLRVKSLSFNDLNMAMEAAELLLGCLK